MTNFEKFANIFGFAPNTTNCLTNNPCIFCPVCVGGICCTIKCKEKWWDSEYKEVKDDRIVRKCDKCGYFLHGYKEDGKLKFDNFCPNCGKKVENEQTNSQEKDDAKT